MKKSKKNNGALAAIEAIVQAPVVEQTAPTSTATVVDAEVKQLGRPVNPDSVRQQHLAEMEVKRAAGLLKRGRPVNGTSERQKRLAAMAEKAAANGGLLKRGRPVNGTSARQQKLAAIEAKKAMGIEVKRGRPAAPKVEEVAPVVVETNTSEAAE